MELRSKELYADLCENPGKPLVVIIGGSRKGIWSISPELLDYLRERYSVLIFAYFGVDKLPPFLEEIPLEYFINGINLVKKSLNLHDQDISIIGNSKGAEAALLLISSGELVKRCRLFCGGSFRPHPRVTRVIRHVR